MEKIKTDYNGELEKIIPLDWVIKEAQSRYFEFFWSRTKLYLNWRKPENNCLLKEKNTKKIITNHKGTRMVKDGEDWHGLQTTNSKNLGWTFQDMQTMAKLF